MPNHGDVRSQRDLAWRSLTDFILPGARGDEREAQRRVAEAVQGLGLPAARLKELKSAVAEAMRKAIEYDCSIGTDMPVQIRVLVSEASRGISADVTEQGGEAEAAPPAPDLQAIPKGRRSSRGWGFFVVEKMVDDLRQAAGAAQHTIELFVYQ